MADAVRCTRYYIPHYHHHLTMFARGGERIINPRYKRVEIQLRRNLLTDLPPHGRAR